MMKNNVYRHFCSLMKLICLMIFPPAMKHSNFCSFFIMAYAFDFEYMYISDTI